MRKALYIFVSILLLHPLSSCSVEDLTFKAEDIVTESDLVDDPDQITFIHLSDVHRSSISLDPALHYLNHTPTRFGLLTGDATATDQMLKAIKESEKPMLLIPGNHDAYPYYDYSVGQYGFRTRVLNYIGQEERVIFANNQDNYWYQDYQKNGHTLRVIGIDQFEYERVQEGPNSLICVYSQEQIDWLINLLENSGSFDGIIFAIHAGFGNKKVWNRDTNVTNDFISLYAQNYDNAYDFFGEKNLPIIPDIINAYLTGVNMKEEYGNGSNGDKLIVTTHFDGPHHNFIAYFGGHAHWDMVEHLTHYPQQLQVLIAYGGDGTGSDYNDLIKNTNNKNSYCFNVNVIDFKKRQLKIIRKGANIKVDGTRRDSIVFNY